MARTRGIATLFMLAEPQLAHSIAHLGVAIVPIGGAIDHHGERFPSMIDVGAVVVGLAPYIRPFFDTIADDIERALYSPA